MRYEHLEDLEELLSKKLITCRAHSYLPLSIYNYTASAQALPIKEWPEALKDCRGLILNLEGEVVGRPFRKFWNYEQVLDQIPNEPFTVWEKLDGSLGIVCNYRGNLVVATRGSFESEQAKFAERWLTEKEEIIGGVEYSWLPIPGITYLFEIIYPENRIVVDYGDTRELRLLAVMEADGTENLKAFEGDRNFTKAKKFAPRHVFDPASGEMRVQEMDGEEGYVVRWASGFRAKVKFEEYKRLHRLITQVSTRTIWEMLRAGKPTFELVEKVPDNFKAWVEDVIGDLRVQHGSIAAVAVAAFRRRPCGREDRKTFAKWAKQQIDPSLMFALLDGRNVDDMIWKMVEPKWATPFRGEVEG